MLNMLFNFWQRECLHTWLGNIGVNYEMGEPVLSKTMKEKYLGITMMPAACKGSQVLGMIRRNITYR